MMCIFCGCSEDAPCIVWDPDTLELNPCHWAAVRICSNPKCVDKAIAEGMTPDDFDLYSVEEDEGRIIL